MIKTAITFGIVGIIVIIATIIFIEVFKLGPSVDLMMSVFISIIIVGPLILFIVLHYFLTKRPTISVSQEEIIVKNIMDISFNRIIKVKHIVNRNAFHSLTIVHLDNGEKYSIAPINKFHGYSLAQFQKLAYNIQKTHVNNSNNL